MQATEIFDCWINEKEPLRAAFYESWEYTSGSLSRRQLPQKPHKLEWQAVAVDETCQKKFGTIKLMLWKHKND